MILHVMDRLVLPGLLPQEGGMLDISFRKDILSKTVLTQEEIKSYELTVDEQTTHWNLEKDAGVDFLFSKTELNFVKNAIDKLDQEKKITDIIYGTAQKFLNEANKKE